MVEELDGQRDEGVGLWSEIVQRGRGAGVAATKFAKLHRLLHKNLGQNKLSFGVFCSVLLSQDPQLALEAM